MTNVDGGGRGGGFAAPAHFFSIVARGFAARHNRKQK